MARPVEVSELHYRTARERAWIADATAVASRAVRIDVASVRRPVAEVVVPRDLALLCEHAARRPFAEHVDAVGAAVAEAWTQRHGATQSIGAGPPPSPVFTNATVPHAALVFDPRTGDVHPEAAWPSASSGAFSIRDLLSLAESTPRGVRVFSTPYRFSLPLRMIAPADLPTWPRLPHSFPVYVVAPGFGAGLATHFIATSLSTGFGPPSLYLGVKKFTPLGPIPEEPYALGFYAVPAEFCQLMHVAVAQLFVAENVVVIDDYHGRQFSISFVEFRQTDDWRYRAARNALLLQYPNVLSDMFATQLVEEPPDDMIPGGTSARIVRPARLANLPPLMVRGGGGGGGGGT
jgi:hypothetical protein